MQKIHIYGGYAGILPSFLLTLAIIYGAANGIPTDAPAAILLAYSGMIIAFFGGAHWLPGIKAGNARQVAVAMGAPALSLVLFILAFLFWPSVSLLGMVLIFGVLYRADAVLLPEALAIDGYQAFRQRFTIGAGALLLVAAIAMIF
ncbi:MAG: DUF3429 domain-containing protein [Alphaproteobacteria bacterium]|nr:DUF3429 domain-containing protein [Alphaproteobacteria bacterium]MCD8519874.1 DUF3429 domain-containing protein [Alphaproteobacteria bacterium]MCD8526328.1 DUF3429 domain-containing protein [Alphaproteobacteria bacterium]MCD8571012.1 DUF3429 domain-containing protein [Alphaproteobacteria bacterium]